MDRRGSDFDHMATQTGVAQQPVDQSLRGSGMHLRPFRLVAIYTGGELPTNAWDDYQPTISSMETEAQGGAVDKSRFRSLARA
jgi:hypothetical protein